MSLLRSPVYFFSSHKKLPRRPAGLERGRCPPFQITRYNKWPVVTVSFSPHFPFLPPSYFSFHECPKRRLAKQEGGATPTANVTFFCPWLKWEGGKRNRQTKKKEGSARAEFKTAPPVRRVVPPTTTLESDCPYQKKNHPHRVVVVVGWRSVWQWQQKGLCLRFPSSLSLFPFQLASFKCWEKRIFAPKIQEFCSGLPPPSFLPHFCLFPNSFRVVKFSSFYSFTDEDKRLGKEAKICPRKEREMCSVRGHKKVKRCRTFLPVGREG